jgi:hypothetical protein
MWNEPTKERLSRIPKLYETENIDVNDTIMHLHFFIGNCDWYACEFDGTDIFFGFVILNGDIHMSEWSYFSLSELSSIKIGFVEIDCELGEYFKPREAAKIDKIRKAMECRLPN